MPAARTGGNPELVELIRAEIEQRGPMTFARFMELALYHPEHGYYRTALRAGRGGDFLTAPEAHPIFGWTLARQLDELWRLLDRPVPFTLREYGPGAGTLVLTLLEGLARDRSPLVDALRYQPVERSPAALAALSDRLAAAGFQHLLEEPEARTPFTGAVLANEFLDALPFHRVVRRGNQLLELFVDWGEEGFVEIPGPLSTPALAASLEASGARLAEGQVTEVNLEMERWAAEVARALERGYVLVFDYGYPAAERYDPDRFPRGTLKTYQSHTAGDDPFRAVGEQDITAHVDFTALERAARQHGLALLGLTTQAEFLANAGIGELLVELQSRPETTLEGYLAARAAAMYLIDPNGMGRFRVMVIGKRVASAPLLRGLHPQRLLGVPASRSPSQPGGS
uniref:SAM-dependent methyltransferase n=2 Tax=Thermorudis TaxID=1649508 RepID=A0A7C3AM76_9BACT